jgi:hypothetical protein
MTHAQLYLSVGVPALLILMATLVNVGYVVMLNQRMTRLEVKLDSLIGKIVDVDNRVSRIEDKLGIPRR